MTNVTTSLKSVSDSEGAHMEISSKLTKQIDEARYLTAENAWRYRVIQRFFYLEYEKMRYYLYKEDIWAELTKHREFSEYTMELCKQDLDALATWGNLLPVQDTSKATTIEEFKNKQFRYQLTEFSVEIERLAIRLENLHVESASLEPSLLETIRIELGKMQSMAGQDEKTVGMWWSNLSSAFRRLNQNYQDYIRDLYGLKAEEMMKTKEFLIFKDKFIEYLRDFIKLLQNNSYAIEEILKEIDLHTENLVMEKAFTYEKSIPRLDTEISFEAIQENIIGKWQSIKAWFLGTEGRESEVEKLLDITNEIIKRITRFAFQISESLNSAANRKEEYKKLCYMFADCQNIGEAHKLSSVAFGVFHMKHLQGDFERKTESINSGVYEEEPCFVSIKPRVRFYREKSSRRAVISRREEKRELFQKLILQRAAEVRMISNYINDGAIDFGSLPEIESHVRNTLLRWLSKGLSSLQKTAKTEDGRVFSINDTYKSERCVLKCDDGNLEMPRYIIKFTGE